MSPLKKLHGEQNEGGEVSAVLWQLWTSHLTLFHNEKTVLEGQRRFAKSQINS